MASFFDKLEQLEIDKISNTEFWLKDNEFEKYKFPDNPKQPTGLAIKADFEKLDHDLQRPAARMLAFRVTSQERLMFWTKVFAFRYHYQLGALDNFVCKWTNKINLKDSMNGEICIQLLVRCRCRYYSRF